MSALIGANLYSESIVLIVVLVSPRKRNDHNHFLNQASFSKCYQCVDGLDLYSRGVQ